MNNNIELYTLYHLLDIDLYTKYRSTINLNYIKEYNKELYQLYLILDIIIQTNKKSISPEEFRLYINATVDSKYTLAYNAILDTLESSFNKISKETIELCLQKMKEKELYSRMAILSMESAEGREKSREELQSIIKELDNPNLGKATGNTLTEISEDLSVVLHNQFQKPGLRWRLNCLNKSLGSIRKGNFGFVFARPETGKTTFLTDQASYMATQTTNPILWFNNEEEGNTVRIRLFESALGKSLKDLRLNEQLLMEEYRKQTTTQIRLIDEVQITKQDIEQFLRIMGEPPSLIIFDQIDKIYGFDADREDLRLGSIYTWARELAKQYCPVIGVCQADGSGDGEKWLTMKNVANAKTSKQAEADFIIGIGMIYDSNYEHTRFINISKNKLMGDQDHDPTLRHGKFQVLIQPEIGRYKDIIDY